MVTGGFRRIPVFYEHLFTLLKATVMSGWCKKYGRLGANGGSAALRPLMINGDAGALQ